MTAETIDFIKKLKSARKVLTPSEFALADLVIGRHGDEIIHVRQLGKWHVWGNHLWEAEKTFVAFDMIRKVVASIEPPMPALEKAKTVAAVEMLVKTDARVGVTAAQLDSGQWLLNTPEGTVELKTGLMREHRREDFITKSTAVTPGGDCPIFHKFLDTIFSGDCDLIDYIQKVLGYCLTGETREHALFFLHGKGSNGKSVLTSTLVAILGDYAKPTGFETFAASRTPSHPTDVASLRGARLIVCPEVEQGRRWAEAKIKSLTGGDAISARLMRQDFFEFTPEFKLLIAGNHKPGLRNVDEAVRRRMHLIPFAVTIPEGDRDKLLVEKLKAERPGILQWMIEGCLRWQVEGLDRPEAVAAATNEYLVSEDTLLTWIEDKCECGPQCTDTSSNLFASWKEWAETNGEFTGSQKSFSQKLLDHGFEKAPGSTSNRKFSGIKVTK